MELKVWVEGTVRVVSGLSLNTSCQDVVVVLAQAIGQTGRYVFIMNLRGNERRLLASDCPLQRLAQLGQLAAEVQFVLQRTGPSLSEGPHAEEKRPVLLRPSQPERPKHLGPQKAFTFNLGPSVFPRRTKPNRDLSLLPRASLETKQGSLLEPSSVHVSYHSKEEVFRHVLQQQRKLQDLELHIEAMEREEELWEQTTSSAAVSCLTPSLTEELAELEQRLRQNEVELICRDNWEEKLQEELDQEQAMRNHLQQTSSSLDQHVHEILKLQKCSAQLEQEVQKQSSQLESQQRDEALSLLMQELQNRLQIAEDQEAALTETERELLTAKDRMKERLELIEELKKELRQCNLQQFVHHTGMTAVTPNSDQTNPLPLSEVYLSNAGIME